MSGILPDKRIDNRIIWIIVILAAIAIPIFGKFREFRESSPILINLSNATLQITSKPLILKPPQPLSRINRSLSIRVNIKENWQPEAPWKQIRLSNGTLVTVTAELVSDDGTKYRPAVIGSAGGIDIRFDNAVPKDKKIVKIELAADHPLTALGVAWVDQNLK